MLMQMEAGEKSPAFKPKLKEISFQDAATIIDKWHYSGKPNSGRFCFGAEWNGELIASTVFVDSRGNHQKVGDLMCSAKNPVYDTFQMSQLLSYCRKQLEPFYDLIVTFVDTKKGTGITYQGDHWRYDGIRMVGDYEFRTRANDGWHTYWKPITEQGEEIALNLKLQSLAYPKKHAR